MFFGVTVGLEYGCRLSASSMDIRYGCRHPAPVAPAPVLSSPSSGLSSSPSPGSLGVPRRLELILQISPAEDRLLVGFFYGFLAVRVYYRHLKTEFYITIIFMED